MSEGVTMTISGKLRQFVDQQAGPEGLYESADEYLRDLIRRDYERHESRKWSCFFSGIVRGGLGIISILHERMDIPNRLKENIENLH